MQDHTAFRMSADRKTRRKPPASLNAISILQAAFLRFAWHRVIPPDRRMACAARRTGSKIRIVFSKARSNKSSGDPRRPFSDAAERPSQSFDCRKNCTERQTAPSPFCETARPRDQKCRFLRLSHAGRKPSGVSAPGRRLCRTAAPSPHLQPKVKIVWQPPWFRLNCSPKTHRNFTR